MVVLDTHVLVWWAGATGDLSRSASRAINRALKESGVIVSAISAWEIAMLVKRKRLVLSMDVDSWFQALSAIDGLRFEPVEMQIAVKSARLPGDFHKDPADRMIVATARQLAVPLVTADQKIRSYEYVETIW